MSVLLLFKLHVIKRRRHAVFAHRTLYEAGCIEEEEKEVYCTFDVLSARLLERIKTHFQCRINLGDTEKEWKTLGAFF